MIFDDLPEKDLGNGRGYFFKICSKRLVTAYFRKRFSLVRQFAGNCPTAVDPFGLFWAISRLHDFYIGYYRYVSRAHDSFF